MFPTIINACAIILGSLTGLLFHGHLAPRFRTIIFQAIGLSTLMIGILSTMGCKEVPILALSMILGGLTGEYLRIEDHLKALGEKLKKIIDKEGESRFVEGFVYSSMLYCVGAMAVVGSFEAGVLGKGDILYTKSLLDGFISIFLAGAMGIGVLASSVTVTLYQGALTLLFMGFGSGLPDYVINEIRSAGGVLIVGIGLSLLEIREIKLGNLLPAMFYAGLFVWVKHNFL